MRKSANLLFYSIIRIKKNFFLIFFKYILLPLSKNNFVIILKFETIYYRKLYSLEYYFLKYFFLQIRKTIFKWIKIEDNAIYYKISNLCSRLYQSSFMINR